MPYLSKSKRSCLISPDDRFDMANDTVDGNRATTSEEWATGIVPKCRQIGCEAITIC